MTPNKILIMRHGEKPEMAGDIVVLQTELEKMA
jgi:hypothetical protein